MKVLGVLPSSRILCDPRANLFFGLCRADMRRDAPRLEPSWYPGRGSSGLVNIDAAHGVGQAPVPGGKDGEGWTFQAGHGGAQQRHRAQPGGSGKTQAVPGWLHMR